jgi:putative transcriptional regulator
LIRKSLDEIRANPYRMTEAERARILVMTDEEIEAAALADPDNPPWTDEELEQACRERDARLVAEKRSA